MNNPTPEYSNKKLFQVKEVLRLEKKFDNRRIKIETKINTVKVFLGVIVIILLKMIRRAFNFIFAFFSLFFFSPLFALVAFLILVTSGMPIFYKQLRVGRAGDMFYMWKFRSMKKDADKKKKKVLKENEAGEIIFKIEKDPRTTKLGRWLRKTSLDEMPQLWNVLLGQMVLVGPRPHLPDEVAKYSLDERKRLLARPGMTGLWQVSGRSKISFEKQVQLDEKYILQQGIKHDTEILIKTIPAIFKGKGAY